MTRQINFHAGAVERIGNPRGRIALYLDEGEAIDLAEHFGPNDLCYQEIMDAVERAYPPAEDAADDPDGLWEDVIPAASPRRRHTVVSV